jgi:hypothetical protein
LKRLRWVEYVTLMGVKRYAYIVLMGELEGKMPFRRSRHTWEGNMKMDIKEIVWETVDSSYLADDRDQRWAVVSTIMNLQSP